MGGWVAKGAHLWGVTDVGLEKKVAVLVGEKNRVLGF